MHRKFVFRHQQSGTYTPVSVMLKRKLVQLAACATLAVFATGCGGINASKSVSPLDFILPGLLKTAPQPATPPGNPTNSVQLVAQVR